MIFSPPRTDREGHVLTTLYPLTNRERVALWYAKRAGWAKYARPVQEAKKTVEVVK